MIGRRLLGPLGGEACALLDDELVPHLVEVAALAEEVDLDGVAALIVTIANLVDHHHHHNTSSDDHEEENEDDDDDVEAKKTKAAYVEGLVDVTDEVGDEDERAGHVTVVEGAHAAGGALVGELLCRR